MYIRDVQWHSYLLPFQNGFSTAHGVLTLREGAIVEVMTEQGIIGNGEIAPLPEFSGESFAQACVYLPKLVEQLRGKTLHEALDIVGDLAETAIACGRDCSPGRTGQGRRTQR